MLKQFAQRLKQPMKCETHGSYFCSCTSAGEPRISRLLFGDFRLAPVWLVLRIWLGWQWLNAGWHKITDPAWMQTGAAVQGFWQRAVTVPEVGRAPVAYDWYRAFLQLMLDGGHHTWFAKLVAVGEVGIGIALVLGLVTGAAAFAGVFMNWHFVMAGTASTNAMLAFVGVLLILAWRTAGWWGLDRWVMPLLGLRRRSAPSAATPGESQNSAAADRTSSPQSPDRQSGVSRR